MPLWDADAELWVHLGVDYSYRNLDSRQTRMRARPMIRTGNGFQVANIVSTGVLFSQDAQQIANLEFAAASGRWTLAAEAARSWVTNATSVSLPLPGGVLPAGARALGTYQADAGYVELLYFLTPDHRRYRKNRPGYDRVIPSQSFYFIDGEHGCIHACGAWEIGIRYDCLDLTHGHVNGGNAEALTLALNWYLNPNARIQWNYFVMRREFDPNTDPGRLNGDVQGLGVRFHVDF